MTPRVLGALCTLGVLLGCRGEPVPRKLPADAGAVEIGLLDSLRSTTEGTLRVAVSGTVAESSQDTEFLVTDGTGTVTILLHDPLDLPVGLRFQARGRLLRTDDGLVLEAVEWLYDSTAVPVRSP